MATRGVVAPLFMGSIPIPHPNIGGKTMSEFKNAVSTSGGKVHKVIRYDKYTGDEVYYAGQGWVGRVCDLDHNPAVKDGWFGKWVKTDKPITCGNCLRTYWPDGRKRG